MLSRTCSFINIWSSHCCRPECPPWVLPVRATFRPLRGFIKFIWVFISSEKIKPNDGVCVCICRKIFAPQTKAAEQLHHSGEHFMYAAYEKVPTANSTTQRYDFNEVFLLCVQMHPLFLIRYQGTLQSFSLTHSLIPKTLFACFITARSMFHSKVDVKFFFN